MSLQAARPRTTLVEQLGRSLEDLALDDRSIAVRRAFMYAEAIDEADEDDAMFRFGPRLRACLEPLGLHLSSRSGISVPTPASSAAA
jgi:hypothetical protein